MRLTLHLLCLLAVVMMTTAGRSGGFGRSGGSRSGGSRGGWGSSSSGRGTSSWGSSTSGSHTWSSGTSSSGYGSHSSGSSHTSNIGWRVGTPQSTSHILSPIKPSSTYGGSSHTSNIGWRVGTPHSTSHILPLSTGARTPMKPSSTHGGVHTPSAPPLPGTSVNSHAPSAPPMSFSPGSNKPPSPGWHSSYRGQAPPPYPGTNTHYPNAAPPPYSAGNYPQHAPPPYSPGSHYPVNQALPQYYPRQAPPAYSGGHQAYYPAPPPPFPGFSPYGTTYYKERSGIRGTDVVAGLALWELMRHSHHHPGYGVQQVHHHHYNEGNGGGYDTTYHDTMRERYTTRITPNIRTSSGSAAYNILEMTHYITPNEKGEIYSFEGNMTCISVYNARSVSNWHEKQVADFNKQFPESVFPLYRLENDTTSENFTIVPGRVIHREPVSITCCGTDKGNVDLNLLTNGKHPNVNCVNHAGHIPIKKLTFIKTDEVVQPSPAGPWHPVELHEPNATTPTPLATFPPGWNETSTLNLTDPILPNITNTSTRVAPFSNFSYPAIVPIPTASSVDFNQTFSPMGVSNNTASVNVTQVFNSLNSNGTTESPIFVTTNSPNDLIIK